MARALTGIVIVALLVSSACARPAAREYELHGQVVAVDPARQEVTISHEDIPQFMPGMTMAFRVADRSLLNGRRPGDLVKATLVVRDTDAHLRTLERTGFAVVPDEPPSAAVSMLAPGDAVADAAFVDTGGIARRFSDWRGHPVAVTFMYTRCPLPNFCPLLDRHFKAAQDRLRSDPALSGVRLLSVSFDPRRDTPETLATHAARVQADRSIWQFVTGSPQDVHRFAGQFGVSVMGDNPDSEEIVHNMRTGIIDGRGRLAAILNGGDWSPDDLVAGLRKAQAASAEAAPRR